MQQYHWIIPGHDYENDPPFDPGIHDGFVYVITNIITGKKYVGMKYFWKEVKRKGKRVTVPSDWVNYWGSSKYLDADIEKYGRENFKREILELCVSRSHTHYREQRWLYALDVLEAVFKDGPHKGEFIFHNRRAGKYLRRD